VQVRLVGRPEAGVARRRDAARPDKLLLLLLDLVVVAAIAEMTGQRPLEQANPELLLLLLLLVAKTVVLVVSRMKRVLLFAWQEGERAGNKSAKRHVLRGRLQLGQPGAVP
jgi:hypothetical protein